MKIVKYIFNLTLSISAIVLFNSCDADKLELSNPNQLRPDTYFANEAQIESAVNAAYGSLQTRGIYNRHIWFGYDNMAHENSGNTQLESDKRQYLNFSFDPTHGAIGAFWESCYRGINKANFVINNEQKIKDILESVMPTARKNKFLGEARFLRALYYFMLIDRFGDVPLMLEPQDPNDPVQGLPRSPKATIWAQIEEDLTFAANNCLDKSVEDAGRATSGAAWGLLGKAYLFQEKYAEAVTAFNNLQSDNSDDPNYYALEDRYLNNFEEETENGVESLFEVQFSIAAGNANRWDSDRSDQGLNESCFRGQEYGCFDWYNVFPSMDLRNSFEAGDPRYGYCLYSNGDSYNNGQSTVSISPWVIQDADGNTRETVVRVGWRKYQNYYKQPSEGSVSDQASGINMKIIRYADILLMKAEALANRNSYAAADAAAATALINEVRGRADVAMTAIAQPATLNDFMVALEHERKVELCGEQVRFPDLVRWGRLAAFIDEAKASFPIIEREALVFDAATHMLWPIPQEEIDRNEAIGPDDQNPGYN